MEEPEKLMWWERFFGGLEEAEEEEEYPLKKDEAVRGEEGWKKNEINQLSLLWSRVLKKKSEECEEVSRKRKMMESGGASEEKGLDLSDFYVTKVIAFRDHWNSKWHGLYGSFEDVTLLHPMQYTYDYAPPLARPCDALQIFSARVITGLNWPLHVFGMVAVRDVVDRNRNLLFYRTRDNCQTLTKTDTYLVLTGPTRAVVVTKDDSLMLEVYLKVKGDTENEDKVLIYYAEPVSLFSVDAYMSGTSVDNLYPIMCPNRHAMLELRVGEIRSSVEATIFVRVVDGSWPDGFHGHFAARTSSEHHNLVLFDFGADRVLDDVIDADRYVKLSRNVVSVELEGSLKVYFMAWPHDKSFNVCQDANEVQTGEVRLKPEKAGRSYGSLSLGSCVMEVLVAWSLVLPEPQPDVPDSFEDYPQP